MTRESLTRALDAAQHARHADALAHLLDAWRATRAIEVADLIDRVSPLASPVAPSPIAAADYPAARHAAWIAVASARRAVDLPALLDALTQGTVAEATERVSRLDAYADDPRTARALVDAVRRAPFRGPEAGPFLGRVFALLVRVGDARAIAWLDDVAASATEPGVTRGATGARALLATRCRAATAALVATERDLCARIARALEGAAPDDSASTESALLDAVYAAPDDDGPRLVYADWLVDRGDPRGEFIQLQFRRHRGDATDASLARERALLAGHARAWLGALADVVSERDAAFERGFLARCAVRSVAARRVVALASAPAWTTVRALRLAPANEDAARALALSPALAHLRELATPFAAVAAALCDDDAVLRRLDTLTLQGDLPAVMDFPPFARALGEARALPHLETLRAERHPSPHGPPPSPARYRALLATPLARRLRLLSVPGAADAVGAWLGELAGHPLLALSIRPVDVALGREAGWFLDLTREAPAAPWTLRARYVRPVGAKRAAFRELAAALYTAPVRALGALEVTIPTDHRSPPGDTPELVETAARKLTSLTRVRLPPYPPRRGPA